MTNDNDPDQGPFPWREIGREFWLWDTRIVATMGHGRGAIVETPAKLLCGEGRLQTSTSRHGELVNALEYHFSFATHDDADPYPSVSREGRIVIEGTHENKVRLEIRGDGWIGYDEAGRVEGHFYEPPVILTYGDGTSDPDQDIPASPGMEEMPPQYRRATLQFNGGGDSWDDDNF